MSASYCSQMIKRSKYSYLTKSFIHFLKKISFFVFFIFYQQSGSTLSASELSWNHSSDKPLMLTTHFPDRWKALKTVRLQSNQLVSKWIKVLQGEVSFWCFILRTHQSSELETATERVSLSSSKPAAVTSLSHSSFKALL